MTRRMTGFWLTAVVGYAVVVLLLAGGMILTTHRFDVVATEQVARIRIEEQQITVAERLRWSGEAIVSAGRGYLISGDPRFLAGLDGAKARFDRGIEVLTRTTHDAKTSALVYELEADAVAFRRHQETLLAAAMQVADARSVAARFETELVPLQQRLGASLARLIDAKEAANSEVYREVAARRARLWSRVTTLVGILVLLSVAIAAYIVRVLARAYRHEQRALETARHAVAARDEVLGVVAHDLRNPLASITMRAALLRETAPAPEVQQHAAKIEGVAAHMASMIAALLDGASIDAGKLAIAPAPCGADELLDATCELFTGLAARKEIRLERGAPTGAIVRADRERMLQVFENLVGNALKFTPPGGHIAITAERERDAVRFRVADSGPGIAAEHRARMFERFWKHETGGHKGTGLGLFIAKGIVEGHRGRIWVESELGHGATFFVTLPLANAASVASVA